jgi:hypothetical protein
MTTAVLSPTRNSKLGRDNDSNKFTTSYSSSFPLVKSSGLDENAPNSHSTNNRVEGASSPKGTDDDIIINSIINNNNNPEDNFTVDGTTTSNQRKRRRNDDNFPAGNAFLDDSRPVPSIQLDDEEFNTLCKNFDVWLSEGAAAKREKERINKMIAKGEATKNSQKEELKQVEEWLSGANLAAVLELSLMKDYIDSLDEDEVDTSGYIQRYSDYCVDVAKQTSTNNGNNNNNNPSPAIAFLSDCFFHPRSIETAERNLEEGLQSIEYKQIIHERLLLLEQGAQKKITNDKFNTEWAKLDAREKKYVESIKCKRDLIVTIEVKDKITGDVVSTEKIVVILKDEKWYYNNLGGIKNGALALTNLHYHPPSKDGKVNWGNGCLTVIKRYLATIVQRLSKGELHDGQLTEETKQSIDSYMTIVDYWTFIPMTKKYLLKEAELLAESGGFDIEDFRLSGVLQAAGQIMSTYLNGQVIRVAVGSAEVSKKGYFFSGAAVSKYCWIVGRIPHGETMQEPEKKLSTNTFSDRDLQRASISANILYACIPSMTTSRSLDVFMVIAKRKPLTAAEEKLLFEMRRASRIKPLEIRVYNDNDDDDEEETLATFETRGDAADKLGMSISRLRRYTDKETGILTLHGTPVCRLVEVDRPTYNGLADSERGVLNGAELEYIREMIQAVSEEHQERKQERIQKEVAAKAEARNNIIENMDHSDINDEFEKEGSWGGFLD